MTNFVSTAAWALARKEKSLFKNKAKVTEFCDRRTLGQIVFVAAYSMYFRANTTTTYPLAPQNAKNEVMELGIM